MRLRQTIIPVRDNATITGRIQHYASHAPNHIAIIDVCNERHYNYRELRDYCSRFGDFLRKSEVAGNAQVVLVGSTGAKTAACLLGAMVNAPCAPLSAAYSIREYTYFLDQLNPALILIEDDLDCAIRSVAEKNGIPMVSPLTIDDATSENDGITQRLDDEKNADDLALLLLTSGTTSRSKVVGLRHRNLCASADFFARSYGLTDTDCCLTGMPLFHIHGIMGGLLASILNGSSAAYGNGLHAAEFIRWLRDCQPTWITAVPTFYQALVAEIRNDKNSNKLESLRFARSASSFLPPTVMQELENLLGVPILESYAMTEACAHISVNPAPPMARKPGSVGLPAGPEIAILDENGNAAVDPEVRGEIAIRGPNVITEYFSAAQPAQELFWNGWLRTGDQGYFDQDGYLYITGRLKELVIRGGHNIAPREIDECLLQNDQVLEAAAFGVSHPTLGQDLVCAVVTNRDSQVSEKDLRDYLAAHLIDYKVPSRVVLVEELLKQGSGNVERRNLAKQLSSVLNVDHVEPEGILEEEIAKLWMTVLKIHEVSRKDSFFDLGGDSLLAAQVSVRIEDLLGIQFDSIELLESMFFNELVAKIAWLLSQRVDTSHFSPELINAIEQMNDQSQNVSDYYDSLNVDTKILLQTRLVKSARSDFVSDNALMQSGKYVTSFPQQGLWMAQQFATNQKMYGVIWRFMIRGRHSLDSIKDGIRAIVSRHDALGTCYRMESGHITGYVLEDIEVQFEVLDCRGQANDNEESERQLTSTLHDRVFKLDSEPPFRVGIGLFGDGLTGVYLVIHHIAFDAWSAGNLFDELNRHLAKPGSLPELTASYADFARYQHEYVQSTDYQQSMEYWRSGLGETTSGSTIPYDVGPNPRRTQVGAWSPMMIDGDDVAALKHIALENGATLYSVLLSLYNILLYSYSNELNLSVGTLSSNRVKKSHESLIGCFANTVIIKSQLNEEMTLLDVIESVQQAASNALSHQRVPFQKLVSELTYPRKPGGLPFIQTLFVFQNIPGLLVPEEKGGIDRLHNGAAFYDLTFTLLPHLDKRELSGWVEYDTGLYSESMILQLIASYHEILALLITAPNTTVEQFNSG